MSADGSGNSLGSTTLNYEATGASKTTNALGMRAMQARVWDKVDAQHLLVKSPPASGKSRASNAQPTMNTTSAASTSHVPQRNHQVLRHISRARLPKPPTSRLIR